MRIPPLGRTTTRSPRARKYNIYIDRNGDGKPDQTYSFRFKTPTGPYFLGNTQQTWIATKNGKAFASGKTPIDNVGPRFNGFVGVKDYEAAAEKTIVTKNGVSIFAGQRDDPFFADVGAIFDLVAIRKAGTTGQHGRRQGLPVRLQRPHDRPADPDLAGRHERATRSASGRPPTART